MTDDTHREKSRLQRLDLKAWVGYLISYQSTNIYLIWIPTIGGVISTRDVVFDEYSVRNGKTEDLMNNFIHEDDTTEESQPPRRSSRDHKRNKANQTYRVFRKRHHW
jgi:hypothetical protein